MRAQCCSAQALSRQGSCSWPPEHGADFPELAPELLPCLAAIIRAEHLAEVGATEQQHPIRLIGRYPPHRTVDGAGEPGILPGLAMVAAAPEPAIGTGRPAAIGDEHHAGMVRAGDHRAGVL